MKRLLVIATGLLVAACSSLPAWVPGSGWTTLIDGEKGLENFTREGDANWRAEGGAIVADKGKGGHLVTKIGANSAYEVNIYDQRAGPEFGTAGIVDFAKVPPHKYKAGGKWNTFEITAKGSQLTVVFNGDKTVDIQNAKFAQGPFSLQFGNLPPKNAPGGAIRWRKVQVREL
jgi:hypothetical protein